MFKLVSLLSLVFVLAACQSSQKSTPRDPAQSKKGNGEVGSVSMSGAAYMNCESLDKKNSYRISIMEEGKELILNLAKDANEIDSRYMSKATWQQLANQEIPFDITFSAYNVSIKRFYRPTSSYLAGEVRSHGPTQKITCDEPNKISQSSTPPRAPAQSKKGNGEVGSVSMARTVSKNDCLSNGGRANDGADGVNLICEGGKFHQHMIVDCEYTLDGKAYIGKDDGELKFFRKTYRCETYQIGDTAHNLCRLKNSKDKVFPLLVVFDGAENDFFVFNSLDSGTELCHSIAKEKSPKRIGR